MRIIYHYTTIPSNVT